MMVLNPREGSSAAEKVNGGVCVNQSFNEMAIERGLSHRFGSFDGC